VLAAVGTWSDVALKLHVEDQAYSTELLRRGEVLAAITSEPHAVQGCSVTRLGVMRYRPAATREFAARWQHGRGYDWANMPVVNYNDKDDLQHELLRGRGVDQPRLEHRVPTSLDFLAAVRAGLGWGMLPEWQLKAGCETDAGELVLLNSRDHVDVPLHWMRWRLDSPLLDRLGDQVQSASKFNPRG
jgi:LysR family transcriptional regulator, chromosome initiation inhibitor